jgi:hypothetical protein
MIQKSLNKWLIIIIILFISFIIIPIILKIFKMKEGLTTKELGKKMDKVKDKVTDINKNIDKNVKDINKNIDKNVNTIKKNQNADKKFIKDNIIEASKNIQNNDETNEKAILDAINKLQPQFNISSQFTDYNTQLTRYNTQLTSLFTGLGDPKEGLLKKINDMDADIAAYNTTNVTNSGAIANMESTIQTTNKLYLDNITDINNKLNIIKDQLDKRENEVINLNSDDYTRKQFELTHSILTNLATNKAEDDAFKVKLRERLKMDKMKN